MITKWSKSTVVPIGEGHGYLSLVKGLLPMANQVVILDDFSSDLPNEFRSKFRFSRQSISSALNEDVLFVSSGFRELIPSSFLNKTNFLNIHYALFPKYRGMHSIVWALLNGEDEIGITIHEMNAILDSGPIIFQHGIEVGNKSSWDLMIECDRWIEINVSRIIELYLLGELPPRQQNHKLATYVTRRTLNDCKVDWHKWNAVLFSRYLRALVDPYPLPFFTFDNVTWNITSAEISFNDYIEMPGRVVYRDFDAVYVKLDGGVLKLKTVQDSNNLEKILPAREILRKIGLMLT